MVKLDAKTLLGIVETRIKCGDGNPTSRSFLFEIHQALQRLHEYESKEKDNISKDENNDSEI